MSKLMRSTAQAVAAAGIVMAALAVPAAAGSMKDAPAADEGRKLTWSFNLGGTSDYVFRGISQTDNDPTMQGGLDLGYGIFYAGVWASGLDFSAAGNDAQVEVDFYAGIKPVYGAATFDFGVIYYSYPSANAFNPPATLVADADLAYFELKAGVSGEIMKGLTAGATLFYSPDYFVQTGSVWTVEGSLAYTLPAWGPVTPTISGLVGYQDGSDAEYLFFNGFDSYTYWNVGLALAVDKLTFDFRYWGSDAENALNNAPGLTCGNNYCDDRFVFSAKVTLP
ncbi:MAG: TorF family putative porin [Hyphomicrobium sp.]